MRTVPLPPDVNPIAVDKYIVIISSKYRRCYHESSVIIRRKAMPYRRLVEDVLQEPVRLQVGTSGSYKPHATDITAGGYTMRACFRRSGQTGGRTVIERPCNLLLSVKISARILDIICNTSTLMLHVEIRLGQGVVCLRTESSGTARAVREM